MVFAFKACILLVLSAASSARAHVLVDFQVAEPPPVPSDAQTCTMTVFEHTFGNSYGRPATADYIPSTECGKPGSWAAVTLNFTVTSNGTQYDRLGIFRLQNTEIWRTSTPEPTVDGITWTYIKDVTRYIPLFAEPGTFLLELNNILNTNLTGEYIATLHATFYASSQKYSKAGKSDLIVPITAMLDGTAEDTSVPPGFSLNVTLPQNTMEIYAELYASGNSEEEFWYYNIANEYFDDLPAGTTYGGGPFREVRLLVDGQVAGVAFPYPVIFTGGINPAVWRPITSYGALDLPTYFLDLTPFAPIFADGFAHNLTVDVVSAEVNHTLNQNWYLSGLLQVVTDPSGKKTTGGITRYDGQLYATTETSASIDGMDVNVTVKAQRHLHIEAMVYGGSGQVINVTFQQHLEYNNTQYYLNNASTQNVAQVSSGFVSSFHNGDPVVVDRFEYPLHINVTNVANTNTSTIYYTAFDLSYIRQVTPAPFILGSTITEHQQAAGYLAMNSTGFTGNANGTNNNTFTYNDTAGSTYLRDVNAAYNMITYDQQSGSLAAGTSPPEVYTTDINSLGPPVRLPGDKQFRIVT